MVDTTVFRLGWQVHGHDSLAHYFKGRLHSNLVIAHCGVIGDRLFILPAAGEDHCGYCQAIEDIWSDELDLSVMV